MAKYRVVVERYGSLVVEADCDSEAMAIAKQQPTDAIDWSEDWEACDSFEDDSESAVSLK